jgi:hypothetical protein
MTETEQEIRELEDNLRTQVTYKPVEPFWDKKFLKDKSGKKISPREFKQRWVKGMQNLSPSMRTKNDIASSIIILIGFIASVVALIFFSSTFGLVTYGLIIIFLGNIYANVIKLFSLFGQLKIYKNIEKQIGGSSGI